MAIHARTVAWLALTVAVGCSSGPKTRRTSRTAANSSPAVTTETASKPATPDPTDWDYQAPKTSQVPKKPQQAKVEQSEQVPEHPQLVLVKTEPAETTSRPAAPEREAVRPVETMSAGNDATMQAPPQSGAVKRTPRTPGEDAHLGGGKSLTWGKEPLVVLSKERGEICLNGIWQFVPMHDKNETQPPGGMAYIDVPGSWKQGGPKSGLASAPGKGAAWNNWGDGSNVWCAWYQRKILIPSRWKGRAIVVVLDRVSTDAIVYANGERCGAVAWPYGEVDISKAVKPGTEALLWIEVMATTDDAPSTSFLDPGRVVQTAAKLTTKGLIGDVFLRSRPSGTHISDVFVQTSTQKRELKLDVEVSDVSGVNVDGPVQFTARLLDGDGREEKRFQSSAQLRGNGTQVVQLVWTWDRPRLWDLQQPNLYTLELEAKGAKWRDEYAQVFGFREFWIDGRKFMLNGTEIRLRPNSHGYMEACFGGSVELTDAHIDGCVYAGFNIEECWPINHFEKGSVNFRELWADRADLKGFLLIGTAQPIRDPGDWRKAEYQETYGKKLERDLRRYRNHPSIVMWTTNPNWLGNGLDQDPRYIGRAETAAIARTLEDWKKAAARGVEAEIKTLDPTRAVLNHAGAYHGDVYNINCYLNFIPLQEREEWLSEWAKTGDMPLMCVEFGTPWKYTFLLGRWGFEASTESMATEYCATYLGAEAYATEKADYRKALRDKYEGGIKFGDLGANWNTVMDGLPAFQEVMALFNRNTYRTWRTWGITGGMIPWDYGYAWDMFYNNRRRLGQPTTEGNLEPFTPGMRGIVRDRAPMNLVKPFQPEGMDTFPQGVALMETDGPTLAWIAGGSDKEDFTSKDHSFLQGQEVTKQVVLINDERTAQEYRYNWTANLGGKRIATDSGTGRIDPAATLFRPMRFRAPSTTKKVTGTIELVARIGKREHKDVFSFRVFPKPQQLRRTVMVYDPAGETSKMLTSLGCEIRKWDGKPSSELIVIGRNALSGDTSLPFDLEAAVKSGGRVLVCAQDPEWLKTRMGLRIAEHLARRVFPVSDTHPVCQGLDATDLTDWSGKSKLVESHPVYPVPQQMPGWRSPDHGWHWGNRGVVTSAAIEKPHRSGWRPILECEFDLAYSPLMELDHGQGRLILCTLDLEDHVALDPAADTIARNIVQYAATAEPIARAARTILVGDDNDRKALENLGLVYEKAAGIDPDADLAIIGSNARYDDAEVRKYVAKGGKVLFLSRSASSHGLGVKLEQTQNTRGSVDVPAWPECQGLSASDLRWRTEHPAWLVASGAERGADGLLGVMRGGKGVAIFCQIDPDRFPVDAKPYFRFTRWRQTRALAQLLANLGARFTMDANAFCFTPNTISLAGSWKGKFLAQMQGDSDPGVSAAAKGAIGADVADAAWQTVPVSVAWESYGPPWNDKDGEAVFRLSVNVPSSWAGQDLALSLGAVDDFDDTYFNGEPVGRTDKGTPGFWQIARVYTVPGRLVKAGKNVIAVRVFDHGGEGGMFGQPDQLKLSLKESESGSWYHSDYRSEFKTSDDPYRYFRW